MEQYEDLFYKREEALQMLADVSRSRPKEIAAQKAVNARRRALIESINAYNEALREPLYDDDPVATAWDKALAEGQMPDFGARS